MGNSLVFGQFAELLLLFSWILTHHCTTSLMNEEDLSNDVRSKGIGRTTADTLDDSAGEEAVVGPSFATPYATSTEDSQAYEDDRSASKG